MKKHIIAILISTGFASVSFAGQFVDFATIKSVEPQYANVNQPVQRCHEEVVQQTTPGYQEKSYGGAILGGVAGGVLGHTVGGGNGKTAATAIGAVVGALTGEAIENNNSQYVAPQITSTNVQRCHLEDNWVQTVSNYKVTYEYKGRIDSFTSQTAPNGDRIRLNVNITPIIDSYPGYSVPNSQPVPTPYIR